ncbi:hypothetical protein B0T14DRAFT_56349 [Immersiella caudata]|uniref:Uncharacterized protein n=1 Tax=Immersiella caudata TaxID=314043 RepID=A0AA39XHG7_9PEZI|nr:hypothetical protein B0T14DRAFT_56349 [Immersiella caudata]
MGRHGTPAPLRLPNRRGEGGWEGCTPPTEPLLQVPHLPPSGGRDRGPAGCYSCRPPSGLDLIRCRPSFLSKNLWTRFSLDFVNKTKTAAARTAHSQAPRCSATERGRTQ